MSDPCWQGGREVLASFVSGPSHVSILWPVKLRMQIQINSNTSEQKHWTEMWTYLTLQINEAKNTLSSGEMLFSGLAWNVLSLATVNVVLFPAFDDLYRRKFLFLV